VIVGILVHPLASLTSEIRSRFDQVAKMCLPAGPRCVPFLDLSSVQSFILLDFTCLRLRGDKTYPQLLFVSVVCLLCSSVGVVDCTATLPDGSRAADNCSDGNIIAAVRGI
jgi:hypothetical protein